MKRIHALIICKHYWGLIKTPSLRNLHDSRVLNSSSQKNYPHYRTQPLIIEPPPLRAPSMLACKGNIGSNSYSYCVLSGEDVIGLGTSWEHMLVDTTCLYLKTIVGIEESLANMLNCTTCTSKYHMVAALVRIIVTYSCLNLGNYNKFL